MKVAETTLLPLAEYPRSRELFRQIADETEVPSPGDPFPGWEFLVPLVRPRKHSLFSLAENPLVVFDEPEQIAAAADPPVEAPGRSRSPVSLPAGSKTSTPGPNYAKLSIGKPNSPSAN